MSEQTSTPTRTPHDQSALYLKARSIYLARSGWRPEKDGDLEGRWIDPFTGRPSPVDVAEIVTLQRQSATFGYWLMHLEEIAPPDEQQMFRAAFATLALAGLKDFAASPDFGPSIVAWLNDPDTKALGAEIRTVLRPILREELRAIFAQETAALLASAETPPGAPDESKNVTSQNAEAAGVPGDGSSAVS